MKTVAAALVPLVVATPAQAAISQFICLEGVTGTCAITLHPVETDVFGVRALQRYKATFIAFEPGPFFRMSRLTWVQGSVEEALPKLERGGAVLVAREFLVKLGLVK